MTHAARVLPAALLVVFAAGCRGEEAGRLDRAGGLGGVAIETAADALAPDSTARPRGPDEIYYDLTAYDWYGRGEPLIAAGLAFQPEGMPRAIPFDSLRRAGNYQGVDFYVKNGAAQPYDTLFVPVFEDFWQPFLPVARAAAPPAPAPER